MITQQMPVKQAFLLIKTASKLNPESILLDSRERNTLFCLSQTVPMDQG